MVEKKTIAILEDDKTLASALTQALEKEGFGVISAMDGESGFKLIDEKRPDLVVLDIILPKKSGFEVMQEVRSRDDLKNVPVIVLTNLESSKDVDRMMELGARHFLVKVDHSLEEITQKIKDTLDLT